MYESRRGSNLPCLSDFGFHDLSSHVGVLMACLCMWLDNVLLEFSLVPTLLSTLMLLRNSL